MIKVLWILNKYFPADDSSGGYIQFLIEVHKLLKTKDIDLHYVDFSCGTRTRLNLPNYHYFEAPAKSHASLNESMLDVELKYGFTFKQAYFGDIIQVFPEQNERRIRVPERYFNDLSFLYDRFKYLEELIVDEKFSVLFSDQSPEVEMEFARVIGLARGLKVFKMGEGTALGRSVIFSLRSFGRDDMLFPLIHKVPLSEAEAFCRAFIEKRSLPYERHLISNKGSIPSIIAKVRRKGFGASLRRFSVVLIESVRFFIEREVLRPLFIYSDFRSDISYLFMGLHLNQESTMVLRAQPYVDQTALIEMLSRVLPSNTILYVRIHPHYPDRYSYKYIKRMKKLPGVRIISEKVSIHKIINNAKAVLTYNATTGIESLIYGKPVLSFASTIYKNHSGVIECYDLYQLGELLIKTINTDINMEETYRFISKVFGSSINFTLGSNSFEGELDKKVQEFCEFLIKCVNLDETHNDANFV